MGAAQGLEPHLAKASVQHFTFVHERGHDLGDALDGDVRIDAVLIEQVDPIGIEPPEHPLYGLSDALRVADAAALARTGLEVDVEA